MAILILLKEKVQISYLFPGSARHLQIRARAANQSIPIDLPSHPAKFNDSPHISPRGGMAVLGSCLHRIRASLHIIAQGFGFTRDFLKERNNSA
ncbi:MAG: hypothetical protein GY815_06380 [Gammaproteobacteria bacterium]|nr:hypothetical protein [Gammaproteobacteria bacterium]